ncbi:N5-glutamine methyltransferase family protein [Nesterenkonia ebinurensis]|uniref:N5-glutamine methyltransferase family protein n=1 Tax=Nesterenkonia ebinurensis TaxID=2608252 RepID=UPI001CC3E66C|nr:HemK/PrmC family methyltransferase [Nesterenkonia ebinurensis]
MTELSALLRAAAAQLAEAQVPSPRADAELLAAHVLGFSRGEVQAKASSGMDITDAAEQLTALVAERARRIPLQHLTGWAPFRTLELRVGPGVFVPRPETETVVELALARLREMAAGGLVRPRVVDLGTGSGAIAASMAAEFPAAEVHAVEVSEEAAAWAQLNFQNLPEGAAPVTLHRCDLRDFPATAAFAELMCPISVPNGPEQGSEHRKWVHQPVGGGSKGNQDGHARRKSPAEGFDLVVSNPPYIPPDMVPAEKEVREHDPEIALYGGGADGLELPRAVIETAKRILTSGGWLILEHAEVQAAALAEFCAAEPSLSAVTTHQDLTGRDRAISAVFTSPVTAGRGAQLRQKQA